MPPANVTTNTAIPTTDFLSLVCQARDGDTLAFDRLVRRFQDMAFGYALSLAPDRATAEDAAQEAFLEAFRCLPGLHFPAAFPGWLRRLVFKHCDRARRSPQRRSTLPLETARELRDPGGDPVMALERQQEARDVREAIRALPDTERAVTSLFYFGGCAVREIATFLEVPEATVRTRLYRARQRLRKDLSPMEIEHAPAAAASRRPSESDRFAGRVLEEMVKEYLRQRQEDPQTADRSLLAKAKHRLEEHLQSGTPLTLETVRHGQNLLHLMGEEKARAALARYFLRQALTVSEEAWTRFLLVNALSGAGVPEECVTAQEEFLQWGQRTFPQNPPRLRPDWDYEPIDESADVSTLPANTLALWMLYIPSAPLQWVEVGRGSEWINLFYEVLAQTPATDENRQHRFWFLRSGLIVLLNLGRTNEARGLAEQAAALGDEEKEEADALNWRGHAADLRMIVAERAGDTAEFDHAAGQAVTVLARYREVVQAGGQESGRYRILLDNIASILSDSRRYEQAIPLLRELIDRGVASEFIYVRLAASLYDLHKDRAEALLLLRQGALRTDRYDLWEWCRTRPAFAEVAEDAEFIAAAARPPR